MDSPIYDKGILPEMLFAFDVRHHFGVHMNLRLSLLLLSIFSGEVAAADIDKQPGHKAISYYNDIRPIFQQNCQGCHQPAKAGGNYIMTSYAELLKKGDRDKFGIVPGKPEASFLVELIQIVNGKCEMPRGKDPLPTHQIKLITDWVIQGAQDDTPISARRSLIDESHPPQYHSQPVITAISFSPDGQYLAISGYHEILLFDSQGERLLARLVGLSERIQSLAFSPDGKTLAVSGGDPSLFGEVQFWDVAKRKLRLSVPVSYDTVYGVSWSPDSSKVAFGCADNTTRAIDAVTGKQVLFQGAHSDWVMGTSFSTDGEHLVSISRDRSVKLTEVLTNRFMDNVTSITPGALKGGLLAVAVRPRPWSEVERAVALVGVSTQVPRTSEIFNVHAYTMPRKNLRPRDIPDVPVKTYDEILVAGADGIPRLYKMHREVKRVIGDDSNRLREYEKLPGRIYALSFDWWGRIFAAGSSLDGSGEVRIFQTDNGKRLSILEQIKTPIYTLSFHPQNSVVASGGFDGLVRLHDPMTGKLIKQFAPAPLVK